MQCPGRSTWLSQFASTGRRLTPIRTQPAMQRFFELNPSFLPGADDIGHGGHHGAWWDAVIAQPKLQRVEAGQVPDFMLVRRIPPTD